MVGGEDGAEEQGEMSALFVENAPLFRVAESRRQVERLLRRAPVYSGLSAVAAGRRFDPDLWRAEPRKQVYYEVGRLIAMTAQAAGIACRWDRKAAPPADLVDFCLAHLERFGPITPMTVERRT
jgi:hypothetical protein